MKRRRFLQLLGLAPVAAVTGKLIQPTQEQRPTGGELRTSNPWPGLHKRRMQSGNLRLRASILRFDHVRDGDTYQHNGPIEAVTWDGEYSSVNQSGNVITFHTPSKGEVGGRLSIFWLA